MKILNKKKNGLEAEIKNYFYNLATRPGLTGKKKNQKNSKNNNFTCIDVLEEKTDGRGKKCFLGVKEKKEKKSGVSVKSKRSLTIRSFRSARAPRRSLARTRINQTVMRATHTIEGKITEIIFQRVNSKIKKQAE